MTDGAPAPRFTTRPAPLALTMGEPAGIGGDITLGAYARLGRVDADDQRLPTFFVLDQPERLEALAERLGLAVPVHEIATPEEAAEVFPKALPVLRQDLAVSVDPGRPDPANGPAVVAAIERAVHLTQAGRAGAVVTNPINKAVLKQSGFRHPGHTEFLGELGGGVTPVMMLACPGLRVVPVTVHLSLREAVEHVAAGNHCGIGPVDRRGIAPKLRDPRAPSRRRRVEPARGGGGSHGARGN